MPQAISFWEVNEAYGNWSLAGGDQQQFLDFTGIMVSIKNINGAIMTDESARRIHMLLGPNAITVTKAYLAKEK